MPSPVRIALVNDYELVVAGLARLLTPFSPRVEVVELDVREVPSAHVDVVMFDTFATLGDKADGMLEKLTRTGQNKVVAYSFDESPETVRRMLDQGVAGYFSKAVTAPEFVDAIERVHYGEQVVLLGNNQPHLLAAWPGESAGLSARESELLALITEGLSNEQITTVCYLSINTVKTYIRSTYRKIGVSTRAQAVAWAMRNGFDIQH